MLDVRITGYVVPLREQPQASLTPVIAVENVADEDAVITGLIRIYRESTGLMIYSSVLAVTQLVHMTETNIAALTPFDPPAPADDDYFVKADLVATSYLPGPPLSVTLGAWHFDIKTPPMGEAPAGHHVTHEDGGSDEIDATGLEGAALGGAPAQINVYTANDTWTKPDGAKAVYVECVASGGGGGGGGGDVAGTERGGGGGGGGGAIASRHFPADSLAAVVAITVPAGGPGGAGGAAGPGTSGTAGATTKFGANQPTGLWSFAGGFGYLGHAGGAGSGGGGGTAGPGGDGTAVAKGDGGTPGTGDLAQLGGGGANGNFTNVGGTAEYGGGGGGPWRANVQPYDGGGSLRASGGGGGGGGLRSTNVLKDGGDGGAHGSYTTGTGGAGGVAAGAGAAGTDGDGYATCGDGGGGGGGNAAGVGGAGGAGGAAGGGGGGGAGGTTTGGVGGAGGRGEVRVWTWF